MIVRSRTRLAALVWLATVAGVVSLSAQDEFFEDPRLLVEEAAGFPQLVSTGGYLVNVFQRYVPNDSGVGGDIFLSVLASSEGREWVDLGHLAGPVRYSRSLRPRVYSMRQGADGAITVALIEDSNSIRFFRAAPGERDLQDVASIATETATVNPLLYAREDGGYILFVTQSVDGVQTIRYTTSENGTDWTALFNLEEDVTLGTSFNPVHSSYNGREYVFFQTLNLDLSPNYQIYAKVSDDGGTTWSEARLVTDFFDLTDTDDYLEYNNQAPFAMSTGDRLILVWRRKFRQFADQVFFADLGADGTIEGNAVEVTSGGETATQPGAFLFDGDLYLHWTLARSGSSILQAARRQGGFFVPQDIGVMDGDSIRLSTTEHKGRLHLMWQNNRVDTSGIAYREPDQRAMPPQLLASNFTEGVRTRGAEAAVVWAPPEDPSGITAYSYTWSQNPTAPVPREQELRSTERALELEADADGEWYLRVRALDRAGNWSEPSSITFVRDRTPPPPVTFPRPPADEDGYLVSNTFDLRWDEPTAPDVAGYTFSFEFVAPLPQDPDPEAYEVPALNPTILSEDRNISRDNIENGTYALSVAPIDTVGNVGEPTTLFVRLNKFIPFTLITLVSAEVDLLGRLRLGIVGRGFTDNGLIETIVLDQDGQEPWDYEFSVTDDDFLVRGNRLIEGPVVEEPETGTYRLVVFHEERGRYEYAPEISMVNPGTIKFGDHTVVYDPSYRVDTPRFFSVSAGTILALGIVAVCGFLMVFSAFRIRAVLAESRMLRVEARALITGDSLPGEVRRQRIEEMQKRGIGLRLKFTLFIVSLVIAVVVLVAFFLGTAALQNQERILAEGLEDRTTVLLDSMTTIVRNTVEGLPTTQENPDGSVETLTYLEAIENANNQFLTGVIDVPDQAQVIDANYVTVTGPNPLTGPSFRYAWATSDPEIRNADPDNPSDKISTPVYQPGTSELNDGLTARVEEIRAEVNARLRDELAPLFEEAAQVFQGFRTALLEGREVSQADQDLGQQLQQRIDRTIAGTAAEYRGSLPAYDPVDLPDEPVEYIFYQPVLLTEPVGPNADVGSRIFYYGMVRLAVSTDEILAEIDSATGLIIQNTVLTALIAALGGAVGALVLASITVIPINRLVTGVETIRDTEDKEELEHHVIAVRTRDELNVLADVINQMTRGLVEAAARTKELMVGKDVQKKFIPLNQAPDGRKLTTGKEESEHVEFFGYYEGASEVSGDYFDFEKLDNEHYAIIKCDVAGHGVSAALIMVEVATIFLSHFKDWDGRRSGFNLTRLVVRINDLVEARGFRGMFAALTVAILNVRTGRFDVCNAGDNLIRRYAKTERRFLETELTKTPASGVFPADLIPSGFPQEQLVLEVGDILLLYTDGIEESHRILRSPDYAPFYVTAQDISSGGFADHIKEGEHREDLTTSRIRDVVNAAKTQSNYALYKHLNFDATDSDDGTLHFDFSGLDGTAEDVVLALVSVEKMWRIHTPPKAGPDHRVTVDRRIDEFLRDSLREYNRYFHTKAVDNPESEYVVYSHIAEDVQDDDLTILGIRKK